MDDADAGDGGANATAGFYTGHPGHVDVEEDEIEFAVPHGANGFFPRWRPRQTSKPAGCERGEERLAQGRLVIDD